MSESVKRWLAELFGTYVLVLGGSFAILSSLRSEGKASVVLISLGFGLALLAGLYAFGEVSGGHFNPAVTLAMLIDRRSDVSTLITYWISQVAGALLASLTVLWAVGERETVGETITALGEGVEVWEGFLLEVVFTAIFLLVILKSTKSESSAMTAFLAISLTLVFVHLTLVPLTGTSVNPVRSLAPWVISGVGENQWIYLIAPLVGAVVGWVIYQLVTDGFGAEPIDDA
jgi:aquaporin Z